MILAFGTKCLYIICLIFLKLISWITKNYRDQREREEGIYEVKPPTLVLRKKKQKVPALPEMFILQQPSTKPHHGYWQMMLQQQQQQDPQPQYQQQQQSQHWQHKTCIRCHRPKMIQ